MKKFFDRSHAVTIDPSTIVFAVFFLLGLYFLYYIQEIVLTFFLAIICMSAVNPGVRWMHRKLRIPKPLGIAISYILIISAVAFAVAIIIPPLVAEVPTLIGSLHLPELPEKIRTLQFSLAEVNDFLNQIYNSFGTVFSIITSTFHGIFTFVTVLVMTAYLLLDRENLHKKMVWFSRDTHHLAIAKEFIDSLEVQLGGWVRGQLFLMLTIGVMTYIGLMLLSVPFALPLALLAGLLEILPNLGPTIATIPGLIVAFTKLGPTMTGVVLVFYILVQQLENHFIVPKIMKENVDVSPLVTILTILIGFKLGGVLGAFLSVPLYILLRNAYSFWMRETTNETH
jgi:predicted PurR-regulated permease PerM